MYLSSRKKKMTVALLAAAVLSGATACGGGGGESDSGKVTLRFSYWGSDARQKLTEEVIKKFEQKNPNIDVSGEFSDWSSYYETLATKVAANDAPDVMTIEIRGLREYSDRSALADLGGKVNTADLDAKVLATGSLDGKQYAIPSGANAFAVVTNESMLKQTGQQVPDDASWTWDDFVELSGKITAGGDGKIYGAQYNFNPAWLQVFAAQRGEQFFNGNKIGVSAETLKAWWAIDQKLIETKGSPSAAKSAEVDATGPDQSLLATKTGAFGMWWSNQLGTLSKSAGEDLTLLRMPKADNASTSGMFLQPAMFYTASSRTEHPAEAAKFIDFMVNDPEAGALLLSDRGLPVNSKVLAAVKDKLPPADVQTLEFIDKIKGELAEPQPAPPKGSTAMEDILQRYSEEVLFGRMTPDEAAQEFLTEANTVIGG